MNSTPTVDNDLQKAIDDITKTTNQDPVFADPVAAPSSMPEGNTGELAESVGPFPAPEPIAPAPTPEPMPAPEMPADPIASNPKASRTADIKIEDPKDPNMRKVKEAALRDLAPLVSKMDLSASRKFELYRNIFENSHDSTVIESAYSIAKDISDENERGEALLYLINSIDNM